MNPNSASGDPSTSKSPRRGISKKRRILFGVFIAGFICFFSLAAAESVLRLIHFTFKLYPTTIEFGFPDAKSLESGFKDDHDLIYVPKNYDDKLTSARLTRPELICMGCSCTEYSNYPDLVSQLFEQKYPSRKLSVLNAGTAGWSTYQGAVQLKRDIVPLHPKAVTIYYGWNDHWMGIGIEDKMAARLRRAGKLRLDRSRLYQLFTKAYFGLMHKTHEESPNRVSEDDFRANLTTMVRTARQDGIIPILLTAPTPYEEGAEPEYLKVRHIRNIDELLPTHRRYEDIVRQVAKSEKAPLCDLAQYFDDLRKEQEIYRFFKADGIHLSEAGSHKIAELILQCLEDDKITDKLAPGQTGKS
ncbi:hypothetical protein HY256_06635 [Candidatus Sumerlaeota bacterium]|nr:hypothetical protein [Candidatus Sumerlaeota bacterium]